MRINNPPFYGTILYYYNFSHWKQDWVLHRLLDIRDDAETLLANEEGDKKDVPSNFKNIETDIDAILAWYQN